MLYSLAAENATKLLTVKIQFQKMFGWHEAPDFCFKTSLAPMILLDTEAISCQGPYQEFQFVGA